MHTRKFVCIRLKAKFVIQKFGGQELQHDLQQYLAQPAPEQERLEVAGGVLGKGPNACARNREKESDQFVSQFPAKRANPTTQREVEFIIIKHLLFQQF